MLILNQANATVLLAHISHQCSPQVAHEILETGAVLALIPLLGHQHSSLQGKNQHYIKLYRLGVFNILLEYGALALGNIAQASPEARSAIIQGGAVPLAVAMLSIPNANAQVRLFPHLPYSYYTEYSFLYRLCTFSIV